LACLLVAVAGMVWLSVHVTQLERTEAESRLDTRFEMAVGEALRTMDGFIYPILDEQSRWPYAAYQPTYILPASGNKPAAEVPSPLRLAASPLVKLYFQVSSDMTYTSPGVPMRGSKQQAAPAGLTEEQMRANGVMLTQLGRLVEPQALMSVCSPAKPLTADAIAALAATPSAWENPPPNPVEAPPVEPSLPVQQPAQQSGGVKGQSKVAQPPPSQVVDVRNRTVTDYNKRRAMYESQNENLTAQTQLRDQFNWGNNAYNPQVSLPPPPGPAAANIGIPIGAGNPVTIPPAIIEGKARPVWFGSELLLARRVNVGDQTVIQGCWFDWPAVKQALKAEVADLFATFGVEVDILPVVDESKADKARMMAALSAQLIVPKPQLPLAAAPLTPVRWALLAAWIALACATLAAAVLLRGVMALSERRAAFVSAVTHELRTPLTTFRMYSEMLAEGMVPDESKRRHYLATLKNEADRLFHLIENVLSYARLERGRRAAARTDVAVGDMLEPMVRRLTDRAARDGMEVHFTLDPAVRDAVIHTDCGALEQILVNLVDNACKYAASATDRRIHIAAMRGGQSLVIRVSDHGPGIAPAEARTLFRPFTKSASQAAQTAPGVGLGLALSQRLASDLGGTLDLMPRAEVGAEFVLTLPLAV
jgi:signal transduction histidine kinase